MASLIIRKVRYEGKNYKYESPELGTGLNILIGPNGSGKSTFSSLLYFGLGGHPYQFFWKSNEKHKEIMEDTDNFVDIEFEIEGTRYLSRRFFSKSYVVAGEIGKDAETLQLYRTKESKVYSDWLLEKLGLEAAILSLGVNEWKLNIYDYMRLMYQNQAILERSVFKAPDVSTFVSDSSVCRKAIFELLLGKLNSELYEKRAELKSKINEKNECKVKIESFESALRTVFKSDFEKKNIIFLEKELSELSGRLNKLMLHREHLKKIPLEKVDVASDLTEMRESLSNSETELHSLYESVNEIQHENLRYKGAIGALEEEVAQVNKVIFSHEKLNLFFPETCPYCLTKVEREAGKCICGTAVEESEYERFFYNQDEYIEIIKGKSRNIDTLRDVLDENQVKFNELNTLIAKEEMNRFSILEQLKDVKTKEDFAKIDNSKIVEVDDQILELKSKIQDLEKAMSLEVERESLASRLGTLTIECESLAADVKKLEGESEKELLNIRVAFGAIYENFLKNTIKDVTSARIDDEYEPSINEGMYREMSIIVGKRLFYYMTLYKMAVEDTDIPFPRFLLVDTPKTAGLDSDTLKVFLKKVKEAVEETKDNDSYLGQVILTTGSEDLPKELSQNVFDVLSADNKLLKPQSDEK